MHKNLPLLIGVFTLVVSVAALPEVQAQSRYPGEAAMVIHYCGKPSAENHDTSPVTGNMQRDLYYGDVILHFAPIEDGWALTTAWQGNLPISRRALEARMPCLHQALLQAASDPRPAVDPTIAMQTATPAVVSTNGVGMPFLWLILLLIVVLIVLAALPKARRRQRKMLHPEDREFRKPALNDAPILRSSRRRAERLNTDIEN